MDITPFFYSGHIQGLQIGGQVAANPKYWIYSIDTYKNNLPKFSQYTHKGFTLDVGNNSKGLITYIVCHLNKQECPLELTIGKKKELINKATIRYFLILLNENGIDWKFKRVFEKMVSIVLVESNVELVFSFEEKDNGSLAIIQSPPR
jgi:hypothetical protein